MKENKNILSFYLKEINHFPLLPEDQVKKLVEIYFQSKDIKTRDKLIKQNLRLVIKIALEYKGIYTNVLDLIQEGNVGLLKGIEKFDITFNVPLSNYVANWIRAYILKFLVANCKLVKIGTTGNQRKLFFNLAKEKAKLEAQGIEATDHLLSQKFQINETEIQETGNRLSQSDVNIDNDSIINSLKDQDNPDKLFEFSEKQKLLSNALLKFRDRLNKKKTLIFNRRFLQDEPDTFDQIGLDLNVSRQRIQQIDVELKKQLKIYLKNNLPQEIIM